MCDGKGSYTRDGAFVRDVDVVDDGFFVSDLGSGALDAETFGRNLGSGALDDVV